MAVGTGYSKITSNGLVFAYDTGDIRNSYLGRPTTNTNTYPLYIYNNVPGNISSTLTATSETYKGVTVYRQTLTALDGSGAGWLSGGNNPGVGVYTYPGGGGNANTYTGHSIFFRPKFTTTSCPVYTHYSNIGGWQSTCNFEDMGDGWFRAYVLWFAGSTLSDGKFWAINPLSTAIGQTITVDWAGQFREDLNSTSISQFVDGTRSNSQSVVDLRGVSTPSVSNMSFTTPAINPQITFDGTNDTISIPSNSSNNVSGNITLELVLNRNAGIQGVAIHKEVQYTIIIRSDGSISYADSSLWSYASFGNHGSMSANQNNHLVATKSGSLVTIYLNGNIIVSQNFGGSITQTGNTLYIGSYDGSGAFFSGQIPISKIYNRALSVGEVRDNYNHYKTRFNLP